MYGRREPKPGEVETPRFTAVWEAIKHLECVDYDRGTRRGTTGNDVCAILDALDALPKPSTPAPAHEGPCYEEGVLEGLEFAAKLADRFKVHGLDLSPLSEEIRKLKSNVFSQEGSAVEPYDFASPLEIVKPSTPAVADAPGEETFREDERQACWEDVMQVLDHAISDKTRLRDVREAIWLMGWKDFGTGDGKPMHRREQSHVSEWLAAASTPAQGEGK